MKLVAISAWNDSGGGFLNRLLDGHPALRVWPYELLLGSDEVAPDRLSPDWFRGRFRWPRLHHLLHEQGGVLFDYISDGELRSVLTDPLQSKHRDYLVRLDLARWRERVGEAWSLVRHRTQASFLETYVDTFFEELDGGAKSDAPLLAHCPVLSLDAERVWNDFPDAKFVHVMRDPRAGFADMHRRHPTLTSESYAAKWSLVNQHAVMLAAQRPSHFYVVTLTALLARREDTMRLLCAFLGLDYNPVVLAPTWQGRALYSQSMGPFGGVPEASMLAEAEKCESLSIDQESSIQQMTLGARRMVKMIAELEI